MGRDRRAVATCRRPPARPAARPAAPARGAVPATGACWPPGAGRPACLSWAVAAMTLELARDWALAAAPLALLGRYALPPQPPAAAISLPVGLWRLLGRVSGDHRRGRRRLPRHGSALAWLGGADPGVERPLSTRPGPAAGQRPRSFAGGRPFGQHGQPSAAGDRRAAQRRRQIGRRRDQSRPPSPPFGKPSCVPARATAPA